MDLAQSIFDNADMLAATGVSAATMQTWVNRGILHLPENQRHPGAGKKRLYSRLDIARIAAIQTLISVGVSAATAAQITERLQGGPTADPWKQALVQAASTFTSSSPMAATYW